MINTSFLSMAKPQGTRRSAALSELTPTQIRNIGTAQFRMLDLGAFRSEQFFHITPAQASSITPGQIGTISAQQWQDWTKYNPTMRREWTHSLSIPVVRAIFSTPDIFTRIPHDILADFSVEQLLELRPAQGPATISDIHPDIPGFVFTDAYCRISARVEKGALDESVREGFITLLTPKQNVSLMDSFGSRWDRMRSVYLQNDYISS